ncbi:hypothetical protein MJD09_20240 [bacterium]|nr:hypothetical protein [bacterium]
MNANGKKAADSAWLIDLIKTEFVNRHGLLSATYPASDKHLLADLDDYLPFLLYYGEEEFAMNQVERAQFALNGHGLVERKHSRIVSYANNEFIGALAGLYRRSNSRQVKEVLDSAVHHAISLLTYDGTVVTYHNSSNHTTYPITAPITGGLLEVLVEIQDLYPEAGKIALDSIDRWIMSEPFQKYGLFLSRLHLSSGRWNRWFEKSRVPLPLKIQNRLGVNFFLNGPWNNLVYSLPFGVKVQTAKDNSNLVFAMIEAYRQTGDKKYRDSIQQWITSFAENAIIDGKVHRYWQLKGKPRIVDFGHIIPVIDILCDAYSFVSKDQSYLDLAAEIASFCTESIQWGIGLYPKIPGGSVDHIDSQTDFIVALHRLFELTGDHNYLKQAQELFKKACHYHSTPNGLVTSVTQEGRQVNATIEPKYNALFLKAIILFEKQPFSIYASDEAHSLMKDR